MITWVTLVKGGNRQRHIGNQPLPAQLVNVSKQLLILLTGERTSYVLKQKACTQRFQKVVVEILISLSIETSILVQKSTRNQIIKKI